MVVFHGNDLDVEVDIVKISLTLAICTYNRGSLLGTALQSLLNQNLPGSLVEILVIDNGSTDNTQEIVESYQALCSRIRYAYEPTPGIANARNRAIADAQGEYLAFLDDDAWAETGWVEQLVYPVQGSSKESSLACVVGPVLLEWEGKRPHWFPAKFEPLLCSYDKGPQPRLLHLDDGYLLTTNAMFHCETLRQLGGFRPYLGRIRGRALGGEDNDIFHRLLGNGHNIYYQPTAIVHHGVPKERQTRKYLMRRIYWDGASQPLLNHSQMEGAGRGYHPSKEATRDLKRCARFGLDLVANSCLLKRDEAWQSLLNLLQAMGRMRTDTRLAVGRG